MTVQNTIVKNVYAGNGSTTVFPYTFALNDTDGEYVEVYVADEAEVESKVTNFKVDTDDMTITYPYPSGTPLPSGHHIAFKRVIPNTQELNLENQGPFFAEDIEAELDRIVMMVQQIEESNSRSIKVAVTSEETADELLQHIYERASAAEEAAVGAAASEATAVASATAAATSESNAATSEANALASKNAAASSASTASASETAAINAASTATSASASALASKTASATSEANALASKNAAATSEATASSAATTATNAATSANASKVAAKASEDAAAASAAQAAAVVNPQMVDNKISAHNSSASAHSDIREAIQHISGIPTGTIVSWPSNNALPEGFLECNGASVLRSMYEDLFAIIGTTYGNTDDEHFNLPNLTDRFLEGSATAGTTKEAGLPNITGSWSVSSREVSISSSGAVSNSISSNGSYGGSGNSTVRVLNSFDASRSSSIYGASDTVQPAAITVRFIIKAFNNQTADSALVDVTQYANELNRLSNLCANSVATDYIAEMAMPSDVYVSVPAGTEYTAPANGYFVTYGRNTTTSIGIIHAFNKTLNVVKRGVWQGSTSADYCATTKVRKGDIVVGGGGNSNATVSSCKFYYTIGDAKALGLIS